MTCIKWHRPIRNFLICILVSQALANSHLLLVVPSIAAMAGQVPYYNFSINLEDTHSGVLKLLKLVRPLWSDENILLQVFRLNYFLVKYIATIPVLSPFASADLLTF